MVSLNVTLNFVAVHRITKRNVLQRTIQNFNAIWLWVLLINFITKKYGLTVNTQFAYWSSKNANEILSIVLKKDIEL